MRTCTTRWKHDAPLDACGTPSCSTAHKAPPPCSAMGRAAAVQIRRCSPAARTTWSRITNLYAKLGLPPRPPHCSLLQDFEKLLRDHDVLLALLTRATT